MFSVVELDRVSITTESAEGHRGGSLQNNAMDAVFETNLLVVDQKAHPATRDFHVSHQLRFMDGQDVRYVLVLDDHPPVDTL